jgi:hypothetical protein
MLILYSIFLLQALFRLQAMTLPGFVRQLPPFIPGNN